MKNINVFGYATFGTPNGFTQSCIYGNQGLEKVLKTFDLKTNAIQLLSPNDRIYSIRKESLQNTVIVSYSVYTYAKEKSSNRSGTFIGTSLVFTNEIIPENSVLTALHDIHQKLKNNNVSQNILNINHSKDFNIQNIFSKDFEKLEHQTAKLNFPDWENSGKNLVIFTSKFENSEIQNLFKKSLQVLSKYDTLFFIDSKEIADFVSQKRLFRLIDVTGLDQEIQSLQEEKKQNALNILRNFKNQKEKITEEGKKESENLKRQIDKNTERHRENSANIEKSKNSLTALQQLYQKHSEEYDVIIAGLESGKQLGEINQSFEQCERKFKEEKKRLSTTVEISSLTGHKPVNSVTPYMNPYRHRFDDEDPETTEKSSKTGILTIISVILNILLIGAVVYLFILNDPTEKKVAVTEIAGSFDEEKPVVEKDTIIIQNQLNPLPNSFAKDEKNKILVLDQLTDNITNIDQAVEIIFEKNEIIRKYYRFQKEDYGLLLFRENPDAFDSNKLLVKKSFLQKIPSYSSDSLKNNPSPDSVLKTNP